MARGIETWLTPTLHWTLGWRSGCISDVTAPAQVRGNVGRKTCMFWSKPKTISFADAQKVLVTILHDVRSDLWAERLAAVSSDSFRSLLGGMGSFSDLVICRENHHHVSSVQELLANELLSCLSEVCYASSRQGALDADSALGSCGTTSRVLSGWRCLACGYSQATSRNLRSLVAAIEVRRALGNGIAQGTPSETLLALWRSPDDPEIIRVLVERAKASGIQQSDSEGWMRPCPACGSNATCVYRWSYDGEKFVPTDDNLPLRNDQP